MSPTKPAQFVSPASIADGERMLRELVSGHPEWFMSEDGRAPVEVNQNEFDFSVAHRRMIFSCWTERGSRAWHIREWNWTGAKLELLASRRMGAEISNI